MKLFNPFKRKNMESEETPVTPEVETPVTPEEGVEETETPESPETEPAE